MASQRLLLNTFAQASRSAARPAALSARAFSTARSAAAQQSPVLKAGAIAPSQQGPYVKGTVNDATTFPPPSKTHGSYHWTFERLTSAALIPIVASTAVTSANPVLDGILCVTLVLHSHMGFDQIIIDYLHPRKFPALGPAVKWILRLATGGTLYGLYEFQTNDIGITELIKRTWKA